jgi:hypothetical protein
MSKEFYTEKDIEDLFKRGIKSLQITENIVLTELAYEKATRLGLQLVSNQPDNPPAAPVRPYLSERPTLRPTPTVTPVSPTVAMQSKATQPIHTPAQRESDIEKRIRSAVIARLGNQVDAKLLDNIIHRVVKGVGLK